MRMKRPSPALVVSCLALFIALGGVSMAAVKLNGSQLKNRSVAGVKLKKDTLGKTEINEEQIAAVTPVFDMRKGPFPLAQAGTFRTRGGSVLLQVSGSAYTTVANWTIGYDVTVDGLVRGRVKAFTNEADSHKALHPSAIVVTGLKPGVHTVNVIPFPATLSDLNDVLTVVAYEGAVGIGPDDREDDDMTPDQLVGTDGCAPTRGSDGGTIYPANDDDYWHSPYFSGTAGTKEELKVLGGPVMDIYELGETTPLATNVQSYTKLNPTKTLIIRFHSARAAAYVFTCKFIAPSGRSAGIQRLGERR